jgi:cell division protein FtsX
MWSNYIILIIRRPKSWGGITLVNLLVQIVVYALILLLVNGFIANGNLVSFTVIILVMLVATIAYANYIALQLKKRLKEFYVRKLLGATDKDIKLQLLLESIVLTAFLLVSAMVFTELVTPWCVKFIGEELLLISQPLYLELLEIGALVIPIGILAALLPINSFIKNLNQNFVKISRSLF